MSEIPKKKPLSPEEREGIYRKNFAYLLIDGILFMVALNGFMGATTVIPDFVRRLTDSEILIGLSGNLFGIGFALPQLFIARYIVRSASKKWWFIGPNIPVRFVILIFGILVLLIGPDRPELILLAFFLAYGIASLGDGLVGVPWSDLIGTSLDSRWRARMFGLTSAITGVLMLAITPVIAIILGESGPGFPYNYGLLFLIAGGIFATSILPVMFVKELPGGKAVEKIPPITEFLPDLGRVVREDLPYRAMIIIRLLTALFLMAAPFYIGFATEKLGLTSEVAVPNLLAMQTAGGIFGAMLYTWIGARSNVRYLRLALLASAMLPASALLADTLGPMPLYFGFFMSGIGTTNLMFGYTNWIVGYANDDERPMYVGLNNTIFAVFSMITPIIAGLVAQSAGYETLFGIALVMTLAALFMMMRYIHDPKEEPPMVIVSGD